MLTPRLIRRTKPLRLDALAIWLQRQKMTEQLREELERQDRDEARERDFQLTLGLAF